MKYYVLLLIFAIILMILIVVGNAASLKNLYRKEKNEELNQYSGLERESIISEKDIEHLPEPVQNYLKYCGFIEHEEIINAEVIWSDSYIKLAPERKWMKLKTQQFNSVPEPMRIAYMKAAILGVIPFEGRDIYRDGRGNMLGKIAGIFTVFNSQDKETSQSALITILAEVPLVPGYALADYITWEEIDKNTANARILHKGLDVGGTFFFNDKGEYIRFETDDRYYNDPKGDYKKIKFTALVDDYTEKEGLKFPTKVKAIWHLPEGEYEYWKGTISDIYFNVKDID
ncbi:DUF6544 family protein [Candidatus Contubernalis alkaliaceticus]|uniref:DUF6544 family protein n=1 Tax=Candidatus Contubernalis alkaliaceticus TaxID=338645 RepID=UPI001F4C2170|nr:DUF6544 family protein [Candidatus Contubernalis alkalaceticus]UNC91334.1 hypothetical protein HUE98_04055 [Candidatus Contubernalis alkalaceticus]